MATAVSSIRSELRARIGNRSTVTLTNLRLDFAIRHAVNQLCSPKVHRMADLEQFVSVSTVASDDTVSLGTSTWTIYSVRDTTSTNERRLTAVDPQFMDELEKTEGIPLRYARWGDDDDGTVLEIDPIPNGVYTLKARVYAYPSFTTDGDGVISGNLPIRPIYDEGVLLGSEARIWMNVLQNPTRGQVVMNQLANWLETIVSPYDGERDDQSSDTLAPDLQGVYGSLS